MNINELIKGMIIGIAKIIPGLSGAVLMISFNLYDRAIDAITNFFSSPKKNLLFLGNLGIGVMIGIVLFSKVIHFFITNYYLYTTSLFIGLILGGIPIIKKKVKKDKQNVFLIVISFLLMNGLAFSNLNNNYVIQNNYIDYIIFFLSGFLEAIGTVLPGISSTALLMLIGIYNHYIKTISNALNPIFFKETLKFIIPFSLGLLLGIIGISLFVNYLFKNHKEQTFAIILGISFSSIFLLTAKVFPFIHLPLELMISLSLLTIGYLITYKL